LLPDLAVRERDRAAEAAALSALASWAGQFTPLLSLSSPSVLLEVEGSLGLFGGPESLLKRVTEGVEALGYRTSLALAPTPLAAELLARAGGVAVVDREKLEASLAPLRLDLLGLTEDTREALGGLGLRTFGELLGLPRPGLVRRFGRGVPDLLDRALGRLPDPRPPFAPPPRFASGLELPAEVAGSEGLLFAAHRLLLELEGFLRARGAGVLSFSLELRHREGEPTRLRVGLSAPGRDPRRLLGLLRERLERTPLPAPAAALYLEAASLEPLAPRGRDLFEREAAALDGAPLIERLRARLGEEAVQGLALAADHRPERAFRWVSSAEEGTPEGNSPPGPRPLWLLPEPVAVSRAGFSLATGPERIESGWWDGADAARDYYVAEDAGGARLWLFRERREGRWFVHGIFG
jgi:protein ImuB